jgi:hypothetical protein
VLPARCHKQGPVAAAGLKPQTAGAVFGMPDSHSMAAVCLAATSSGAFTRFETHELIEAGDLTAIAERAKGITYQPPGA